MCTDIWYCGSGQLGGCPCTFVLCFHTMRWRVLRLVKLQKRFSFEWNSFWFCLKRIKLLHITWGIRQTNNPKELSFLNPFGCCGDIQFSSSVFFYRTADVPTSQRNPLMGFRFDNSFLWNSREFQIDYERIPLNSRSFDYCL